jgi:ubiquinone/menaquinone biosynthesis C-methylase UbiE
LASIDPGAAADEVPALEEPETESFAGDSAYDSASYIGDDTNTLASYITDYRYEHGRRYHRYKDGSYWGPNDDSAMESQDLAHHMYLITLDTKLHLAPLRDPQAILDVGTGTGIWAIDMADQYPGASVTGVDLSPIQPAFVPPNCSFEVDDLTLEWTYPESHFDCIHIRELFGSIPDWDFFLQEAYKCTKPNGWIEVVEHSVEPIASDDSQPPGHFYYDWGRTVVEMGVRNGKSFTIWREAKERLERAGFVDVVEVKYSWPMNGWPADPKYREIGRWNQLRLDSGIEGFMLRLLTNAGNASGPVFPSPRHREGSFAFLLKADC